MWIRVVVLLGLVSFLQASAAQQEAKVMPLDQALRKARADGKYRMLLRQIRVESDLKDFGDFYDLGYNDQAACAGHSGLPKGYWVYVYPYWYIWRDRAGELESKRPWGPEHATGKPDTPSPGDHQTAWASATQDSEEEWLMVEFANPVRTYAIHVYETYNPGSIVRITGYTLDGSEVELWRRARPVIPSTPAFVFRPLLSRRITSNRIKLYLDSKRTPGWNEIDAVRLRDEAGGLQWAESAESSSAYGISEAAADSRENRIRELEMENRRLREELEAARRGTPAAPQKKPIPGASFGAPDNG